MREISEKFLFKHLFKRMNLLKIQTTVQIICLTQVAITMRFLLVALIALLSFSVLFSP